MLHSISIDVCTVDERVNTGLDAPKNKHDSILMALNHGVLSFGSKDRYYVFSTALEDNRYAVIVSMALSDQGPKELQVRVLGSKRKHNAQTKHEMLWSQRQFTEQRSNVKESGSQYTRPLLLLGAHFFTACLNLG